MVRESKHTNKCIRMLLQRQTCGSKRPTLDVDSPNKHLAMLFLILEHEGNRKSTPFIRSAVHQTHIPSCWSAGKVRGMSKGRVTTENLEHSINMSSVLGDITTTDGNIRQGWNGRHTISFTLLQRTSQPFKSKWQCPRFQHEHGKNIWSNNQTKTAAKQQIYSITQAFFGTFLEPATNKTSTTSTYLHIRNYT